MQTESYADLLARIQALAGVDQFATTELTMINSFINRRGYQAYRVSDTWARYIVVGQARPGPLNIIPYSYDETAGNRTISSASRSGTTVTVVCSADIDGDFVSGQYVTIAGLSGTVDPNGVYQVTVGGDATFSYEVDTTSTATETYTGSGTVAPVALVDVDSFIRVFRYDPTNLRSGIDFQWYVDSSGCHVLANAAEQPGFWVTFKKEWDGPYSATGNTAIPREFFDYIAHASYADFLRLDQQTSKAIAEEGIAEQYLTVELARPQNMSNAQVISRVSTYTNRASR